MYFCDHLGVMKMVRVSDAVCSLGIAPGDLTYPETCI